MKASSYGLKVLAIALALTAVFAVREACSMAAKTQEAQLPAEPDVAFLEPGSGSTGANGSSSQMNTEGISTNSAPAVPSSRYGASLKPAGGHAAVPRWTVFARIWNAWAAFIVHR